MLKPNHPNTYNVKYFYKFAMFKYTNYYEK